MIKREYWENGRLWYEHQYHQNQRHGTQKGWYEKGQLLREDPYHKGQRHGIRKRWDENGQLELEKYYLYDNEVTPEEYRHHELVVKLSGL